MGRMPLEHDFAVLIDEHDVGNAHDLVLLPWLLVGHDVVLHSDPAVLDHVSLHVRH